MWKILRKNSTSISSFPEKNILALPVALSQTVYTTIGCRLSRISHWQETPSCTFASAATAAAAASVSLRATHSCPAILVAEIIRAFEKVAPAKEIGCRFNVSGATAMRYFRCVNHKPKELPEVVSLDEFKGNSGGQKYNSIVADPKNHKVIDILPNRCENDLIQYFSQFESRKNVKYFVCDMNPHFRQVAKVCFKNAVIVADRYHVIRQVYWAMERVRKNEQNKLSIQFRKYFKKSRYLLMRPMEKLTEEEADQLALMFEIAPRLAAACRLILIFN